MKIRLAAHLQPDSVVDGAGIRTVVWTQGCPHHCPGCHNPETHDYNGGALLALEDVYQEIDNLEGQTGITFSGGEPFEQPEACSKIAKYARKKGYNIWCYTGYTIEQLFDKMQTEKSVLDFLREIDVLVDGRFVLQLKSLSCIFRGSKNQRILDVPASLKEGRAVPVLEYLEKEEKKDEPLLFV